MNGLHRFAHAAVDWAFVAAACAAFLGYALAVAPARWLWQHRGDVAKALLCGAVAFLLAHAAQRAFAAPKATTDDSLPCAKRSDVLEQMKRLYGEVRAVRMTNGREQALEILASPNGSWSMFVTLPNGVACLIGTGLDFEILVPAWVRS